jgi:5-hydroxyisourate hydrolase-like protein (transthyretin family)
MKMLNVWFGSLALLCLFFTTANAQDSTATLSGVIVDTATGEKLEGVSILIRHGRDTLGFTETNSEGKYLISSIKKGSYRLEYKLYTYYGVVMREVPFEANKHLQLDIKMKEDKLFAGLHMAKPKRESIRDFLILIPLLSLFVLGVTAL